MAHVRPSFLYSFVRVLSVCSFIAIMFASSVHLFLRYWLPFAQTSNRFRSFVRQPADPSPAPVPAFAALTPFVHAAFRPFACFVRSSVRPYVKAGVWGLGNCGVGSGFGTGVCGLDFSGWKDLGLGSGFWSFNAQKQIWFGNCRFCFSSASLRLRARPFVCPSFPPVLIVRPFVRPQAGEICGNERFRAKGRSPSFPWTGQGASCAGGP